MCYVIKNSSNGRYYTGKKDKLWGSFAEAKPLNKHDAQCTRGGLRNSKKTVAAALLILRQDAVKEDA